MWQMVSGSIFKEISGRVKAAEDSRRSPSELLEFETPTGTGNDEQTQLHMGASRLLNCTYPRITKQKPKKPETTKQPVNQSVTSH